ncbi:MAG: hypothetical protein GF332_00520 [Candidatus Moranbacteria bacterium]|nr:hypothetical protein [Candidatus Moranbacteria bacterium]
MKTKLNVIDGKHYEAVLRIQKELRIYKSKIENTDLIVERSRFMKLMEELIAYIYGLINKNNQEVFKYFKHSSFFQENKVFFSRVNCYYARVLETIEAIDLISQGNHKKNKFGKDLFINEYPKILFEKSTRELKELGIDKKQFQEFVILETGSLPVTILAYFVATKIPKIIGVDSNQEAIYMAGEITRNMNKKEQRISYSHFSPLDYNYSKADIVYIPSYARNKRKILDRIAKTAKDGVMVLCRTPVQFGELLLDSAEVGLNPRFFKECEIKMQKPFLDKLLVLSTLDF